MVFQSLQSDLESLMRVPPNLASDIVLIDRPMYAILVARLVDS
jgi:hypothetical protein